MSENVFLRATDIFVCSTTVLVFNTDYTDLNEENILRPPVPRNLIQPRPPVSCPNHSPLVEEENSGASVNLF